MGRGRRPGRTLVTIDFEESDGATRIVLAQTGFREASEAKGHEEGWSSALARFAGVVEAREEPPKRKAG